MTTMNPTSQRKSRGLGVALLAILLILVLTLASGPAAPAPADTRAATNVQPELLELAAEQPDAQARVIIQKNDPAADIEAAIARLGGKVINDLHLINAVVAEMGAETAVNLAQDFGVRWVSLDAPVVRSQVDNFTLRDEFNVAAYNNNDGTELWAGDWTEYNDDNKATRGYVKISNGFLSMTNVSRYLEPAANLFGATSAILSFEYAISSFDSTSDFVTVEIFSRRRHLLE